MTRGGRRLASLWLLAVVVALGPACRLGGDQAATPAPTPSPTASLGSPAATPGGAATGDWLRFGFDPARSGVNPGETTLSAANVAGLHRLWRVMLPGVADSSPALLHALRFPDGSTHDVLYVTTRDGRLIALDAGSGATFWSKQTSGPKITNSSPVVDPGRQFVYAYGLDGTLHRYRTATGEETTGDGWPVPITRLRDTEKESSALNIDGGRVYVTTSGYFGDATPYQGHVVTVDAASGAATVFNSLCADQPRLLGASDCQGQRSGMWARAGAVIDPVTHDIFVATGNGPFDADKGGHDYGDSVLRLSPDGSRLLDSYTPSTYQQLDDQDADLGSTAPAMLPRVAASKTPLMAVQGGKDGTLRLLNRENLSGAGGPGHVGGELQTIDAAGCVTFTQPVAWAEGTTVWVVVAGTCGIGAYQVATDAGGASGLRLIWKTTDVGTTPVLEGGMLFVATDDAVLVLDPHSGQRLWSSAGPKAGGTIGGIHWESPIVIDGRLYVADESGALSAYGL